MDAAYEDILVRANARLGTVLRGRYRLDSVLGVGGMAVVYQATHRSEAEPAVKMLHPELSFREDFRTRFLPEGHAANSVRQPGPVLVLDDDVAEDGAAFLVMQLPQGAVIETLWERLRQQLPIRAVLSVADQLLDLLAAAHAKGVVHRDIKPANLFATRDGTLKVLDFGIARVKEVAAKPGGGPTSTGLVLGTPSFMAPEQASGKASEIDGQTDVWAVGATLFTLLTGQTVHEGENAAQIALRAATMPARRVGSVAANVPPVVARVIDRALAFDRSARWASAAAMREAIERASLEAFRELPSKSALAMLVMGDDLGRTCLVVVLRERSPTLESRVRATRRAWGTTPRECAVLAQLVSGSSNKEIALKLGIHEGSVERHVTALLRKANVASRCRLVARFWML